MAVRPIDEKIVAMKMDNSDFIKKAADTTSIFGKIQSAMEKIPGVNLSKVGQSFADIQSSAQKVNLSSISNNVEHIASQFSKLNVVAITALSNITNRAVDAGLTLAKNLTVQPVMDGFREYELKMKSIGTMLANTEWAGSTLSDVKKTLGELNTYADKTIYSFAEMTANIGRFTAAGVTLEDSATAIKGLGNLAAVSGSDVNQLNTVMYQMSQALAAGKLNLMDWNSLVNGGMAGKKTQDALVATAKAMGKNVDLTDGFRNSIEQGWLTSEVFLETLKKFGTDESMTKAATSVRTFTGFIDALKESVGSGWAETWELVFGDFDEATRRWTGISQAVGGFFQMFDHGRNSIVKAIADAGIFKALFDGFVNTTGLVLSIFKAIGSGIKGAFAGTNLGLMRSIGSIFTSMGEAIKPNEKMLKNISVIFEALFSPVALVVKILDSLGKVLLTVVLVPLKLLVAGLVGLTKGILAVTGYISGLVVSFSDGVKSGEDLSDSLGGLTGIFSKIGSTVGKGVQHVKSFISAIKDVGEILIKGDMTNLGPWAKDSEIANKILNIRKALIDFNGSVKESWRILSTGNVSENGPWAKDSEIVGRLLKVRQAALDFAAGIEEAWDILSTGAIKTDGPWVNDSEIVQKLFRIRDACMELAEGVKEAWDILTTGAIKTDGPWVNDSRLVKGLFTIRNTVIEITDSITETIKKWTSGFGDSFKSISDYAESVDYSPMAIGLGLVAKSLEFLVNVMKNGLWEDGSAIDQWMAKVGKGFSVIGKGAESLVDHVKSINISLEPVTSAFDSFFDTVGRGYEWVVGKLKDVGQAIKDALPNGNQLLAGGFIAGLVGIVGMALKMAWDLYEVFTGWGKIGQGVSDTLDAVAGALNGFASTLYANAIMTISIALGILAVSLLVISKIDTDRVTSSLYGIIGIMTAMVGAMAIMTKYDITGTSMGTAMQMVAMGTAVLIMATALKKLSDLNPGELTKSVLALGGIMLALSGSVALMSKFGGGKVGATALQFVALAAAVHILVDAINEIAKINVNNLQKGLTTIGIILLELGIFFALIRRTKFGIGDALAFISIAHAVGIISDSVKDMGKIDVDVLKQGLITIGAILAAIALFAAITSNAGLLATGAGLLLVAAAITAFIIPISILGNMDLATLGIGLGAIAIALVAIGAASMLMTGMIAAGAGLILVATALHMLIIPIATLGSMDIKTLATGIVAFASAILLIGGAAALIGLAAPAIYAFAGAAAVLGLALLAAGAGMSLFSGALVVLAGMTATAITTIVATLGTLIVGLVSLIPTAIDFMVQIIMQLAKAIMDNAPKVFEQFVKMVLKVLKIIGDYTDDFVDAAVKIITNFLDGLAKNVPKLVESATNLMVTFVEALAASVEKNSPRFIDAWMRLMAEVTLLMVQAGIAVVQALFGWIPGVTDATNKIGDTAEKTIRDAFDAKGAGNDKGKDFASGLNSKSGDAKNAGTAVANAGKSGAGSADLAAVGAGAGGAFATALGSKTGNALSAGKNVGQAGLSGADSISLSGAGSGAGAEFISGLSGQSGSAGTAGTNLANAGKSGAAGVSLSSTGSNFGLGFAGGINSKSVMDSVVSAAKSLASAAKKKVEDWLDIRSPSRVMMETGGYFGEGFGIGIADQTKSVAAKAKNLAITAKDSLNKFLDGFELPEADSELRFKAVIDYEALDTSKFGNAGSLNVRPDTSFTVGTIAETRAIQRQNADRTTTTPQPVTTETSKSTVIEQNLNFYSRELTPSEVARKNLQASRQLAAQWT